MSVKRLLACSWAVLLLINATSGHLCRSNVIWCIKCYYQMQGYHVMIELFQAPHCTHMRSGTKFGDVSMVDAMLKDGLIDAFHNYHMGITGIY